MQIVVGLRVGARDPHAPLKLPPLDPAPLVPPGVTALPPGIPVRDLTLNEDFDQFGRLIQRLGTTTPLYEGTFARNYEDAPTETPSAGAIAPTCCSQTHRSSKRGRRRRSANGRIRQGWA